MVLNEELRMKNEELRMKNVFYSHPDGKPLTFDFRPSTFDL